MTTVKLKPQVILDKPDHQMTIEIETKLGEKGQLDFEKDDLKAETWFRSQSTKGLWISVIRNCTC